MLETVIRWSVRHRGAVIAAWLAVAVSGILAFQALPFDAFPDTTPVQVQVNAQAPALGPLECERLVTMPLEQAVGGLPGLIELRSLSRPGFSQLTLTFDDETDVLRARQSISERLGALEMPPGVERPSLGPVATGLGEVFHYLVRGQEGDALSPAAARGMQDWLVAPQLRAVPGVAEVNSWGGDERRVEVVVDLEELQVRSLTLEDVVDALARAQGIAGGGTMERGGEATLIQARGLLMDAAAIASVPIMPRDGAPALAADRAPALIRDVAEVREGRELRHGAVTTAGQGEAVLGLAFMLPGQNSHDVTKRLALRLDEIRKALPPEARVDVVYQRSELVDRVLRTVRTNLLEGALLVVAVLFLFLGNLRAGLLVALAIPFSLLVAFDLMLAAGVAGTLMSLGAIDFGLVVDSSVILVENAARRLDESGPDADRATVIADAAVEVRRPTMFGELIIMAVYLPILTLEGLEGRLFRPMALTVIFALAGSMVLSLTLVPALASLALRRREGRGEGRIVEWIQRLHAPILVFALRRRAAVVGGAIALVIGAGVLATRLGAEFVPRLSEGTIVLNTVRLASVSLDESVRMGSELERLLLQRFPDEIETIWTRTGSAEIATDPMGVEVSDVFVQLRPREEWTEARTHEQLVARMREVSSSVPGMRAAFTQPIEMRVNEMVAGIRSDVGVKVFGDDLELLRAKALEVQAILRSIPGAADVSIEQVTGSPVLLVDIDRAAAARHGVDAHDVLQAVQALAGIDAGEMQEGLRRVPIAVRLPDASRLDASRVGAILVTSALGGRVPVSDVARLDVIEAPSAVQREWGRRRVVVQTNVQGRDVKSFVEEARRRMDEGVELPPGSFIRFGGQFEHLERAERRLLIVVPITLALILTLLFMTYRSWLDALRVFTGVPLAAVGGVLALWLRGMPFSVSAAIGFVALSGVSVLGDMVLVSTIRQFVDQGRHGAGPEGLLNAVREATRQRLRPVLMTALVASLGFLPMALSEGPGAEVQRPLATVVIGGVLSSTLLTLVVLPVLYVSMRRVRA